MAPQVPAFIRGPLAFLVSRPGFFVVMAFLLAAQNTYASTLVASLFLSRIGADSIPFYYVLFAAVSIPFAALFSAVIDRFPRPVLFHGMLGLFIATTVALAATLGIDDVWYYAAFLAVRVFEHMLYSVYYILFADYFTVIDTKRYAGRLALGMAVGGLAGGGLVTATTGMAGPLVAACVTPMLVALVSLQLFAATRRFQPLDAVEPAAKESLVESLQIIPRLMRRYPVIALLAGAMFLNVLLQCIAEFLAFSIYTIHYPSVDDLAVFLGLVNAGLNLLGFVIIVLFTDRQLPRIGVPKMNRIYPALDVVTFGVLTVSPSLPAGILANVSYDPFEHGIDVPVANMNYNAVGYRFVGRVRVFIDGMIFPLGLASAGLLLTLFKDALDLQQIAGFALFLSLIFFALHWNIGKQYARRLVEMLRDGAVDFDKVESGLRVPPGQIAEIRAMLASDARGAEMGLQMAVRCDGDIPASEIAAALARVAPAQARAILADLADSTRPAHAALLERLTQAGPPGVRQLACERLLGAADPASRGQAAVLLADPDEGVRCVSAARVLRDDPANAAAAAILDGALPPQAALGAIEMLRAGGNAAAIVILARIGRHPDPAVRAAALSAAATFATDRTLLQDWAERACADPADAIRKAAFPALIRVAPADRLEAIAVDGLGDAAAAVRQAAAQALGERGDAAMAAIARLLRHEREDVQLAAIDALQRAKGAAAGDLLFAVLQDRLFATIDLIRRLARGFPAAHPAAPAMRAAHANARRRALRVVMHALDTLGHRRTLDLVRTMLNSSDRRSRANAIESLASLPHRRFVVPLIPLLDDEGVGSGAARGGDVAALIRDAGASPDPWLRAAAAVAAHADSGQVPPHLLQDASPVVAETVRLLLARPPQPSYRDEALMSRLGFLHDVPLFAETSLDDLVAVDRAFGSETYLKGEAIVTEGEAGDRLCIVYRGQVVVRKGNRTLAQLGTGDFFGEMSLFDDEPRSATVTALDEVEVLVLQRDRFHSLVQQRPSILMELCTTLVRRLRQAEQEALGSAALAAAAQAGGTR